MSCKTTTKNETLTFILKDAEISNILLQKETPTCFLKKFSIFAG